MDRRDFMKTGGALATWAASGAALAQAAAGSNAPAALAAPPTDAPWRRFEVTTAVELAPDAGATRLWLPLPKTQDTDYQRASGVDWKGNPVRTGIQRDPVFGAPAFFAEWTDGKDLQELTIKSQFAARNRYVDLAAGGRPNFVPREELALYLEPTNHIPLDGIVGLTARKVTGSTGTDPIVRARAIYDWIVENAYRDPKVAGCGTGDIVGMLESGKLGGKCADLNALFVGLARASGIPARDVYGVRVADSATWKSLGKSGDISKAQHCRAEFYDARFGWIPVDPADVLKVVIEENGLTNPSLPLTDPRVALARKTLFGFWEMNWVGFNTAGDTRLAPPTQKPLGFFMYPYTETARGTLNPYDPAAFRYTMTSREITA